MPTIPTTLGVPIVSYAQEDATVVPALNAATVLASVITPTTYRRNSLNKRLNGSYKIAVALMGRDESNFGYTIGRSSAFSAVLAPVTGNSLLIEIASPLPAGMEKAVAAAIFLQKGSADPVLTTYAYINSSSDFSFALSTEAFPGAPSFTTGLITSITADETLGDRAPKGVTYRRLTPTTRGVRYNHRNTQVPVSLDTSVDFNLTTARGVDVGFSVVRNDLEFLMQAIGGNYTRFTATNLEDIEIGEAQIYTTAGNTQGNSAIKVIQPPEKDGSAVTRLFIGNLIQNQTDFTEEYRKDALFALDFNLQSAALDLLSAPFPNGLYHRVFS